ncbi:MAG: plasmid stabilization protein, partial [Gammaproteobacteria bacterium]|nr:plasmid stabilization protein [Gammaproteobacteria bacterium]
MNTTIKVIKNDAEHVIASELLSSLMESDIEEDDEKIELLALVIEEYENKAFPIEDPSPIDAIKFRMEQEGLTQRHLIPYIGSLSKVSEVLNGKRKLSLNMIRNLSKRLGISADILIALPDAQVEETNI